MWDEEHRALIIWFSFIVLFCVIICVSQYFSKESKIKELQLCVDLKIPVEDCENYFNKSERL